MPAITSGNVTVTVSERWISNKKKHVRGTIAFGDGSLTYPTGGVPLPSISQFGFLRSMDALTVYGLNGLNADYVVRYDPTNHKLLMYEEESTAAGGPLPECDTSEAPAARTYNFYAIGW